MNLNQKTDDIRLSLGDKKSMLKDFSNTIDTNSRFDKNAARVAEILSGEKSTSNKQSRGAITRFLQDIDVEALSAVFILAGTAITSAIKFYRNMRKLNENEEIVKFEPIEEIDLSGYEIQGLFESQDFKDLDLQTQQNIKEEVNNNKLGVLLDNIRYQFIFDYGGYMETLSANLVPGMELSLRSHKQKTSNFNDFLVSVENFVERVSGNKLTDNDKQKLQIHYNKYR